MVHHREHAGEALVFLADEVADRTAVVAEAHHAGRTRVNAQLVLDGDRIDVVALADAAVGIDEILRHQEQRDSLDARGRLGQSGEHEVDDVVGHRVIAPGDEYLLAEKQVVIVLRLGARAHDGQVRTGL